MQWKPAVVLALVLSMISCVGVDLVDETLGPLGEPTLTIEPASVALELGQVLGLSATYLDAAGVPVPSTPLSWTSQDPSIATVSSAGAVSGLKIGQTTVTVAANGRTSAPALVTVVAAADAVATVTVTPAAAELALGEMRLFTAVARNLAGAIVPVDAFTWTSSDPVVATIDADGLATANAPGQVEIRASTDGVSSSPAVLEVLGVLRTGTFVQKPGSGHPVGGDAVLEQQPSGLLELRFGPDFFSVGGPDVRVFLSHFGGVNSASRDLGALVSFEGAQSYAVPSGIALDDFDWVVIHCVPFNITFGYAELN